MNKNSKRFMRDNIRRSRRLIEVLPRLVARNKIANKLSKIEANYELK